MIDLTTTMLCDGKVPVGTRIRFRGESRAYTVQASNAFMSVCTKPFAARRTVMYCIVDWKEKIRGPENLVLGMGAETREQCEEMLARLTEGESEISYRNRAPLEIVHAELPQDKAVALNIVVKDYGQ